MNLARAIRTFNERNDPPIGLLTTRDGRVVAHLPRAGSEAVVAPSTVGGGARVTAEDVEALCEEARLAGPGGHDLLAVATEALDAPDAAEADG